jgi:pyrroloquinoline-quinone synthase
MNSATEALRFNAPMLSPEELRSRLLDAISGWRFEDTRMYALLHSGRCPPQVMRRYAAATYHSAKLFCATIAEMVDKAPDAHARLILLENLMEEEGIILKPQQGLVTRASQSHPALAMRFVEACGGSAADITAQTQHATGPGRQLLAQGQWTLAVANLLVGQELKFATVSGQIFDALRGYGLSAHDLAFFAVHVTADQQHGDQALQLVIDHCATRDEQDAAIAAASDGARTWFEMHGGAARQRA